MGHAWTAWPGPKRREVRRATAGGPYQRSKNPAALPVRVEQRGRNREEAVRPSPGYDTEVMVNSPEAMSSKKPKTARGAAAQVAVSFVQPKSASAGHPSVRGEAGSEFRT